VGKGQIIGLPGVVDLFSIGAVLAVTDWWCASLRSVLEARLKRLQWP